MQTGTVHFVFFSKHCLFAWSKLPNIKISCFYFSFIFLSKPWVELFKNINIDRFFHHPLFLMTWHWWLKIIPFIFRQTVFRIAELCTFDGISITPSSCVLLEYFDRIQKEHIRLECKLVNSEWCVHTAQFESHEERREKEWTRVSDAEMRRFYSNGKLLMQFYWHLQ